MYQIARTGITNLCVHYIVALVFFPSDVSDADNYDPMCPASHPLTPHDPPLLFHLHSDPGERYNLAADPQYRSV